MRCATAILFVLSRQTIQRDVHETRQFATLVLSLCVVVREGSDRVPHFPRFYGVV